MTKSKQTQNSARTIPSPDSGAHSERLRLMECRHHDPFAILGLHTCAGRQWLRVFRPDAGQVEILYAANQTLLLKKTYNDGFFEIELDTNHAFAKPPRLKISSSKSGDIEYFDPYCFPPVIPEQELLQFHLQPCYNAHQILGARAMRHREIEGVLFAVWAPNAERVSVVADFNHWDGRVHPMRNRGVSGVWELFITDLPRQFHYKFEIRHRDSGRVLLKSDPYGRQFALRPDTATVFREQTPFQWRDQDWLARRAGDHWQHQPISIYEVHLGSWQRREDGGFLDYRTLAHKLVDYVKTIGFTHLQLLPMAEHPFDGSWGYQVTGYFAPTSRFGNAEDFKYFVDYCHRHDIGVLLDWVPAHFPRDDHALACFDGSALYEHADPKKGEHRDWGTLIFNYGRNEVRNFLFSSAAYWLEEFHIDGLRVDAVASMLYLDYSRQQDDWLPNKFGGRENLEAIEFLQLLNQMLHRQFPGALVIAEESTSWPGVSRPVHTGGLGFTMKWNMGWMNDTLEYFANDPIYRPYHHEHLTFGLLYAFSENFVLPLSHDEVVHGKKSILDKMPGDPWQQFANVRLLYSYMFCYPGKKLLFMGNEFAQGREWNHDRALDWELLQYDYQRGIQLLVRDLNRLYRNYPALHRHDFEAQGFHWIDCHDHNQSVVSFLRRAGEEFLVVVVNATPVPRHRYRIGVPDAGVYGEIFNSDSSYYGGGNISNGVHILGQPVATMGCRYSIELTLPPLAALIIARQP